HATEFTFVAALTSSHKELPPQLPRIVIDFDAHFEILATVVKNVSGFSPFAEGQQIVFLVHSPWLSFHSYSMQNQRYRFVMIRQRDPSMKDWEYLIRTMEPDTQ